MSWKCLNKLSDRKINNNNNARSLIRINILEYQGNYSSIKISTRISQGGLLR